jgi:Rod binding domain-containing protein
MRTDGLNQATRPLLATPGDGIASDAQRLERQGEHAKAAQEMETVFGMMLVRELRRALPQGLFGKGPGADVFEGWFDEHLGKALAERDALGLSGMVKTSLQAKEKALETTTEAPR